MPVNRIEFQRLEKTGVVPVFFRGSKSPPTGVLSRRHDYATVAKRRERLIEGIAGGDVAIAKAALKPLYALCTAAVGKRFWYHSTNRLLLQPIIANRRGGRQCLVNVTRLKELETRFSVVGPEPGKTIGLQFQFDGQGIAIGFGQALPGLMHLFRQPH